MALDLAKLNLGEISLIEDFTGLPYDEAMAEGQPKGKAMAALGLVAKRREQLAAGGLPTFSWNDAQKLTFQDVATLLGWDQNTDEEVADDAPKEPSPASKTTSSTPKAK